MVLFLAEVLAYVLPGLQKVLLGLVNQRCEVSLRSLTTHTFDLSFSTFGHNTSWKSLLPDLRLFLYCVTPRPGVLVLSGCSPLFHWSQLLLNIGLKLLSPFELHL